VKKLAIIFFSVIAIVWLVSLAGRSGAPSPEASTAKAAATQGFADAVSTAVKTSPKWSGIQVDEASGNDYTLVLLYKAMPSSQLEVEHDTKAVMQAVLNELVKQGRNPAKEHIFVTVRAHKPEKGATGQSVVRVFGRSVYDYNNDSITYKPEK